MTKSQTVRVVCRQCRNVLTTPLFIMSSKEQIRLSQDEIVYREHLIATVNELRNNRGELFLPHSFPFDFVVANSSVSNCQADKSTFGCCGHTPSDGPNLLCRCGTPVGWEWSDCIDWAYTVFDNRLTYVEMIES